MKTKYLALFTIGLLSLSSCKKNIDTVKNKAAVSFGDQNFKTVVSLVELYKTRHGYYPESLKDVDFMGNFDKTAIPSVTYKKLEEGYTLDLTSPWAANKNNKAERAADSTYMVQHINYPSTFWKGLGIKKSNLKR